MSGSVDECAICGANHMDLGDQIGCGRIGHGHRLLFHSTQGGRVLYQCPAYRCATRITTPRQPEPAKGETMTAVQPAIHHPLPPATDLAIRGDQDRFDKYQLAALRTRGLDNVPNPELAVFFHYCKAHGLDPFSRHATMVKFGSKWTIITEIDGFRHLGHRAANRRGDIIAMPGPVYIDTDGNETTYWTRPPTDPPGMVKQTILKNGAPYVGVASYWEFGQFARNKDGTPDYTRPQGMTRDMPANQTAKCAEAQAWRKAYQDIFADIPLELAVDTSPQDTPWHVAATAPRSKMARDITPAPTAAERIRDDFGRLGVEDEDEQFNLVAALAGTDTVIDSLTDLPLDELDRIAHQLAGCEDVGQVHALIANGDKP